MFEAFNRSWGITKSTFHVIKEDKEILLFPIIAGIASLILVALFIIPFLSTYLVSGVIGEEVGNILFYIILFIMYWALAFVATFANVGVVYIAKERFSGKNATFSQALSFAASQWKEIFLWSIVSAVVGVILKVLENAARGRNGQVNPVIMIIRNALGFAWSVATIFVVPIIVYKDLSPFQAIKESVSTVRKTWGESIIRFIGIGIVQGAFTVAGIIVGIILIMLCFLANLWVFAIALIIALIVYLALVSIIFGVANSVFNTALYIYATTGKTPASYGNSDLKNVAEKR